MEFTLTFGKALTQVGNTPAAKGAILVGKTIGLDTTPEKHDNIGYQAQIFASHKDKDNGEAALRIKGITEGTPVPGGRENRNVGVTGGIVSSADFDYEIELAGNKAQLTEKSLAEFLKIVKGIEAPKAGLVAADLT